MLLERLQLLNFRNFQDEILLIPNKKIIKIAGSNGSGKTNLLEAVYILYTSRSFRNKKTMKDCVREGDDFFSISAQIQGISHALSFSNQKIEKNLFISKEKVKSLEFIKGKNILHFSPEESHFFFQSHEYRRSLLDRYVSAVDEGYLKNLIQYNHLKSRKVQILLSTTGRKKALLELESPLFVDISSSVSTIRGDFLEQLNPLFQSHLRVFNHKLANTKLVYRRRKIPLDFLDKEIANERILYGCHKDELDIVEDGKEVRAFFSNGEKKAINLAFHFSFMEYLKTRLGHNCLVCLDDIESELDQRTLQNIHGMIDDSDAQFLITSKLTDQTSSWDFFIDNGRILSD